MRLLVKIPMAGRADSLNAAMAAAVMAFAIKASWRPMNRPLIIGLALAVCACMEVPGPPPPPYHAVGTEPFWNLLIDEHDITFLRPGQQPIKQPTPKVIIGIAGEIYRTTRIDVNIVHTQVQRRHERAHLSRQGRGQRRRETVQWLWRALSPTPPRSEAACQRLTFRSG